MASTLVSGGDSMTLTFSCFGTFDYPKELFEVTAKASLMRSLFFVENNYYGIPGAVAETFPCSITAVRSRAKALMPICASTKSARKLPPGTETA